MLALAPALSGWRSWRAAWGVKLPGVPDMTGLVAGVCQGAAGVDLKIRIFPLTYFSAKQAF